MKSDDLYLRHILDAIARAEAYVDGVARDAFLDDPMRQDAVVRQLEIVGEASCRLSDELRACYDGVPWRAIIGMRNRIAHDYLNIDVEIVWEVVRDDLPQLKAAVQRMLDRLS